MEVNPEWELSDELCARFWDGLLGIIAWTVKAIDHAFEVENPYITKSDNPLELNQSDKLALGRSTRKFIGAGMKRAGIKSVEEAEKFINFMDGGKVLIAIIIGLTLHFVKELPKSGLIRKMREDAAKGGPSRPLFRIPWQRGPAAPAATAPALPTPAAA